MAETVRSASGVSVSASVNGMAPEVSFTKAYAPSATVWKWLQRRGLQTRTAPMSEPSPPAASVTKGLLTTRGKPR